MEASSSLLANLTTRRSFIVRVAVAGSAMAVAPLRYLLRPGTAYATVCGPDSTCATGYTAMCCTVSGTNRCPPGSFPGGWWKADNSGLCCGNTARYYIDCNMQCGQTCTCHCATGSCDQRKSCCNQFRYGQCHQEIACSGPIVCRVVTCNPPWMFDTTCTTDVKVDPNTAQHSAPCLPGSCSTPIDGKWYALGAERSFLGWPIGAELDAGVGMGRFRDYEGGSIYWTQSTGAHEVHGAIRDTWKANGGATGFLGYPFTDALLTADKAGRYQAFQGGSIYWSAASGAHEVHGAVRDEWQSLGYENGFLGYPLTDALVTPDGAGRVEQFQGGTILWSAATGAHEVHGAIRDNWRSNGAVAGFLGFPLGDPVVTSGGAGRSQQFQGGTIIWSAPTGAHEIHGAVRDNWNSNGGTTGFLGYPLTDALVTPDGAGRSQQFQGGYIFWLPATGAHEVHGPILQRYTKEGGTGSALHFPTSDVTTIATGQRSEFQGGAIEWDQATNTTKVILK
ncbi:MAG: hypothetical protein QOK20_3328 [Acidimicrobiaceae bacterium]|nr:hypothetical protein [Acidimicrobiaceae bacterium]MDQ1401396.1 hypothetical protein [Acidimicrobiaceae bacterium]